MKPYDRLMSQLTFREDFCEDTLKKASQIRKAKIAPRRRPVAMVACICLCTIVLLGTALAVSPTLRAMLIPNFLVEATEEPKFPTDPNMQPVNIMEGVTVRYYKLDGESAAHEGFGSVYPVTKNGKLSFYSLTEQGWLEKAKAPRHIQKDITYKGKTWSLDMDLYAGDIPVIHEGDIKYPIDGNHITLGRWEGPLCLPIYVDLTTFEIQDPAEKLSFVPDKDAFKTYIYGAPDSSTLLIRSELSEDLERCYYGNGETGQVVPLGEGAHGSWSLYGGKIYFYDGGSLYQITENGTRLPLLGGNPCYYDEAGFAYRYEGSDLHVMDLRDQGEYLLVGCAEIFSDPVFTHNRIGSKLCISNAALSDGLYSNAIAIVDRDTGTMVTLKRSPTIKEQLMGWFDHDHFLIGGTVDEEWYIALYEIS